MTQEERRLMEEEWREGLEEGMEEGEERFSKIILILARAKRYDDLSKASKDKEYRKQLYELYGI